MMKKTINPNITEKQELMYARLAAVAAICVAGYFGINPPGFVAIVVALAFGLAAASIFPAPRSSHIPSMLAASSSTD